MVLLVFLLALGFLAIHQPIQIHQAILVNLELILELILFDGSEAKRRANRWKNYTTRAL